MAATNTERRLMQGLRSSTFEEFLLAQVCLKVMAIIPVLIAAFRSTRKTATIFSSIPRFNITPKTTLLVAAIQGVGVIYKLLKHMGVRMEFILMYFILVGLAAFLINDCSFKFDNGHKRDDENRAQHGFIQSIESRVYQLSLTRCSVLTVSMFDFTISKRTIRYLAIVFLCLLWLNISMESWFLILMSIVIMISLFVGIILVAPTVSLFVNMLLPTSFPNAEYHLLMIRRDGVRNNEQDSERRENIIDCKISRKELVAIVPSAAVIIWYMVTKHWIANDILAMAFSTTVIEMLHLNSVFSTSIWLAVFTVDDVIQVYFAHTMITESIYEFPGALLFPSDILRNGMAATNFRLLGVGDVVLLGIFLALLLRFDKRLNRNTNLYFYAGFCAYIAGMITSGTMLYVFEHPQPALLYLVPQCVLIPVFIAFLKSDLPRMFSFRSEVVSTCYKATSEDVEKENHLR